MTPGFRISNGWQRPDAQLIDAFRALPTAIISDNMHRLFAAGVFLIPIHQQGTLCGSAFTVRTRPGDNLMVHKALDLAQPGDVIVVDAGGDTTNSIIGEIMWTYAKTRGIAGFVINGAVRDVAALSQGDLPVYAIGATHRGPYKDGPGEIGTSVSIAGMVIYPGDIVVGDADGVLVVPQAEAAAISKLAKAQLDREAAIFRDIAAGTLDRSWVDTTLAEKGLKT